MCSIGGVRRFGESPIRKDQLDFLLTVGEKRGNDAAGVAIQQKDGAVVVFKEAGPAWRVIAGEGYQEFVKKELREDSQIVLTHTRSATQGSPQVMENNHPLFNGLSAVVHNGGVDNEKFLFERLKLPRVGEVDSDVYRAILDAEGLKKEALEQLNKCKGAAALAAVDVRFPGRLLLAKSGHPLVYAMTEDHLVFGSTSEMVYAGAKRWTYKWGIWGREGSTKLYIGALPTNTAWILDGEGLKVHEKFETYQWVGPYVPDYAGKNKRWGERQKDFGKTQEVSLERQHHPYCACKRCKKKGWNKDKPPIQPWKEQEKTIGTSLEESARIKCLNPGCNQWCEVPGEWMSKLWKVKCAKCKNPLGKQEKAQ